MALKNIYNRIRYLIRIKSGIPYVCSHYFTKTKVVSYDSLSVEKRLTLHIESVPTKDKNHYCYKIFFEKHSYQLAKN